MTAARENSPVFGPCLRAKRSDRLAGLLLPALTADCDLVRFHARIVLVDWAFGKPDPGFPRDRAIQRPIPEQIRRSLIKTLRTVKNPGDLVLRAMLGEKIPVAAVKPLFAKGKGHVALRLLAEIQTQSAGRELRRIAQTSRKPQIRLSAAIFLARRNDPSGAAILRQASAGPPAGLDADSRIEALVALLRLGDAEAARDLRRQLRNGTERDLFVMRSAFRRVFRERMCSKTWKADARRLIRGATQ
jgi:hypothetical protein